MSDSMGSMHDTAGGRAWRFALRELRGGLGSLKLLFFCVLLGVFAMASIGSLSSTIFAGIAAEGQTILGGDLVARFTQRPPTAAERRALQGFGGATSDMVTMRAMVGRAMAGRADATAPDAAHPPVLGELKAVDANWPLYGEATLAVAAEKNAENGAENDAGNGNAEVQRALAQGAVVGADLARQLGLRPGDTVTLGNARLPVSGILGTEPDRGGEGFTFGPTILIALDRLPETGLLQPGSLYHQQVNLRLPRGVDPAAAAAMLQQQFPDAGWRLRDRDNPAPGISRFIGRLTQFLLLVSLVALAIAGIGVGNGIETWLRIHAPTIATLKALGAESAFLRRIYAILIGAVALVAALFGAALGAAIPWLLAGPLGRLLPVAVIPGIGWAGLGEAIALGLLIALAFAIVPLERALSFPIPAVLRREETPGGRGGLAGGRRARAAAFAVLLLVALIVLASSSNRLFTLAFLGGTAAILALLLLCGILVERGARRLKRPSALLLKLALGNLARPGARTRQLIVALGLGLSLFAALSFIQSGFDHELKRTVPAKAPAYFLLDLPKSDRAPFLALLPAGSDVRLVPSLRGPVVAVNDRPASTIRDTPEGSYLLRGDRGLTFSATIPDGNDVVDGRWWPPDYAGPPLVSMDAEQARLLGLHVGDTLTASVLGVEIRATIASLRRVNWDSLGFNFVLVYDPHTLAAAPYSYMATVTPPPDGDAPFRARMARAFPSVPLIRVADVLDQIGGIMRQTGFAVRAAAASSILAGIAVLIGALAAQERARRRDNVILKALGATRAQLIGATLAEHAAIALVVGALALVLGAAAGFVVVDKAMGFPFAPDWGAAAATVALGAVLVLVLGLVGSWRALGASVADALRSE